MASPRSWIRTTVRVPIAYVRSIRQAHGENGQKAMLADVKQRAIRMGLPDVRAVMQDPTNNELIRIVSRKPAAPLLRDDVVAPLQSHPVEAPPTFAPPAQGVMDPGLTGDELEAVRTALLHERNPRHLSGFASTLEPYFPVTASLLRTKGILLECRARRNSARLREANERAAHRTAQKSGRGTSALDYMRQVRTNASVGQDLSTLTERESRGQWKDVARTWPELCNNLPERTYSLARMRELMQGSSKTGEPKTAADLEAQAQTSGVPIDLLRDDVRRAACLMIQHPEYVLQDRRPEAAPLELDHEQLRKFSPVVLDLAKQIVREIALGVWIVDPDKLRSICPPDEKQGFVSPSALQLALALSKPRYAQVVDPPKVFLRNAILQGERPRDATTSQVDLLKAQVQMDRATRAIERRRWVEWYRRASQSGLLTA